MKELKVYVPQDGPYGLEPEEGGEPVEEETCYLKSDVDFWKKKLDDEMASRRDEYEEAEKEIRRLKRALWLARANNASSFASLFSTLGDIEDDESRTYWIFGNKRKIVIDKLKCHRMETSYKWFCIWDNVADKCRAKAEEYK